ncbi:hypothetical protein BKA65DRAFT_522102 [Rhexocercosporidium sp. MPI-PUGE-AT-0058]|nr:hypothetical protein BKA65DRAFT_522102 [Rhexocercosporidium sp. MPI-PUGE-AT-0058]
MVTEPETLEYHQPFLDIKVTSITFPRLWKNDTLNLSRTSKSVREACLPCLFHSVEILFSTDGFNGLKSLIESDARYHIVSFTYVVPKLLKPNFSCFQSQLLTPDNYVEITKEMYDASSKADEYPSYIVIYKALHNIYKEQRNIIDKGVDLSILCLTFRALPRLTEVGLSFYEAIKDDLSPSPFTAGMTTTKDSYKYHLKLLQSVRVLRLSYSSSPLELLSRYALNIYQLNMCYMVVKHNALQDFLEANKRSLYSIGFYDVTITESSRLGSRSKLSSDILCKIMKVSQSSSCRAADCGCLPFRKEGWRMLLNGDNHP